MGAIIWNEQGQVMAAMTASGPKVSSSEEAELLTCDGKFVRRVRQFSEK